jgi:hypothetical protein
VNAPKKRQKGRPAGSGTGASPSVLCEIKQVISAWMLDGGLLRDVANRELVKGGAVRFERYQNRWKDEAYQLWEKCSWEMYRNYASATFPALRYHLIELSKQAGEYHDKPGQREMAKHFRDHAEEHADSMLESIGLYLISARHDLKTKHGLTEDQIRELFVQYLEKPLLDLIKSGPSALISAH